MSKNLKKINKQRGVALFIALIVTGMLLAISLAVSDIALKQIQFSSTGRESQKAFFSANTGIECALYWFFKKPAFLPKDINHDMGYIDYQYNGSHITCDGSALDGSGSENYPPHDDNDFWIATTNYCAKVSVTEGLCSDGSGKSCTKIDSRGYNTTGSSGTGNCSLDSFGSRTLERGISVEY